MSTPYEDMNRIFLRVQQLERWVNNNPEPDKYDLAYLHPLQIRAARELLDDLDMLLGMAPPMFENMSDVKVSVTFSLLAHRRTSKALDSALNEGDGVYRP